MPMIRYQIRNEYGLADPELYGAADRDDPEAILEGVAMAGLVGVLRQLGDLAEFAAELFHELHEEVMATVGRGHGLMLRVQQLETEFPSIEKAFLSQTNHSKFAYNAGIDWHANLRTDQNLVTQGDMPRFILNSYEECRGPPRLFMLDRFDVAGAGACLKRYTDPSFFKMELASSGMMEEDVQRERKTHKIKKVSRWRNGEAVESFLAPDSNSNLQPGRSEKVPEKNPKRRVNLKPRRLNVVDTSSTRSYMENLLEVHSPEQKVLLEISRNQLDENTNSTNLNELAHPGHEVVIDKLDKYFSSRDNSVQLPSKQISELCTNEQETKKINDEKCLETLPNPFGKLGKMYPTSHTLEKKEVLTDSDTTTKDSGISYKFGKAEKSPLALREVYQHKFPSNAQYLTEDYQRKFSADTKCVTEGLADSFVSDDIGSEVENYVDALNTMESEMETDFERKFKLEPVLVNVGSQGMLSSEIKGQEELISQFSDQEFVEKSTEPSGLENMYYREISSVSKSDYLSKLDDVQPSQQCINGFGIPVDSGNISEEMVKNCEVVEIKSSVQLLSDGTYHAEPPICNLGSEVGGTSFDSGNTSEGIVRNSEVVEIKSSVQLLSDGTRHTESPICNLGSEVGETSSDSGDIIEEIVRNREVVEIKSSVQLLSEGPYHAESPICNLVSEVGEASSDSGDTSEEIVRNSKVGEIKSSVQLLSDGPYQAESPICDLGSEVGEASSDSGAAELAPHLINICPQRSSNEAESATSDSNERFACDFKSDHEVADNLDDNLPCKAEISEPILRDIPPLEHVEELISEDIGGINDILELISQKQDERNVAEASSENGEDLLRCEPEDSKKQDLEACSSCNMSPTTYTQYPEISSLGVQSDTLATEMEKILQPEDQVFPASLRGTHDVKNLNGTPLRSSVPDQTHPTRDDEMLESSPKQNESILEDVSAGYANHSTRSFTWHSGKPQELIEQDREAKEVLNFAVPSKGISDTQSSMGPGNADGTVKSEILWHSILPHEFKHFSEAEEPQVTQNVESTEFAQSCSMKETFSCDMELRSEPVLVGDDFGLPSGSSLIEQDREAKELLNFAVPSEGISDTQSSMGLGNADDTIKTEILWHSILPLEFKHFSEAEEPQVTQNVESTEFAQSCSMKETFSCDMELQSEPVLVGDDFGLLSGSSLIEQGREAKEVLNFAVPSEVISDTQSSMGLGNADDTKTEILWHSILPLEFKHFFEAEEPHVTQNVESTEFTQSCSIKETFSCDMELQSGPVLVGDDFGLPSGSSISNHHKDELKNEQLIEYDDILTKSSPAESAANYHEPSSRYSSELSGFHVQTEDIYVPHDADQDGNKLFIHEVSSSDFLDQDLSDPADSKLFNDTCHTNPPQHAQTNEDPYIDEENPLYSLERDKDRDETPSDHFFVQPAISVEQASRAPALDEPNVVASCQGGNHLEASVILEQDNIGKNSVELSDSLEQDPCVIIPNENINEMDMSPLSTGICRQLEPESLLAVLSTSSLSTPESAPQEFSKPQISDPASSIQLQETPPLPPLPPLEWRLGKLQADSLIALKDDASQHGLLSLHTERVRPLRLSELPPIVGDERLRHGIQRGIIHPPTNVSLSEPCIEDDRLIYFRDELWGGLLQPSNPNAKPRSIRDRPRHPLIDAVAAHDKSKLRKISELVQPSARPEGDESDTFLDQIRNKTFNLKPTTTMKPNMKGPQTNLKVAAILEKANAIRHACAGSDEDDDGDNWNDPW